MKRHHLYSFLLYISIITLQSFNSYLNAEVKLPQVISSNMVFQRNAEITVWGWASSRETVKVSFDDRTISTRASRDGKWSLIFPAMKEGGPYEMLIEGRNNFIRLENILIGDVWICSGQSNMEWSVSRSDNPEEEISNADYPMIRLITVKRTASLSPAEDILDSEWTVCNPSTIPDFSAVAYYFGRKVHVETGIPIGLINTSWGGTNVEAWTSSDFMASYPEFTERLKLLDPKTQNDLLNAQKLRIKAMAPNEIPSQLFNGMIYPLLKLRVAGAIWYQGEANASRAYRYRELFPNMINCWRTYWNQPDMPFFFVQLANFRAANQEPVESEWAELREAQLMALSLPRTGMAVSIDIGDPNDIHPRNKQDVGKRLALNALQMVYSKNLTSMGPLYKSMDIDKNRVILSFDHTGSGLMAKDKYGYLKGFTIAGEDMTFHWARAHIHDNKVIVYSPHVTSPVAVRYGWADNPEDVNLYNMEGLPASPFRTDNHDGITKGKL